MGARRRKASSSRLVVKELRLGLGLVVSFHKLHWGPKSPVMQSYGIQKSIYGRFLFHFVIWEIFNLNLKFYF